MLNFNGFDYSRVPNGILNGKVETSLSYRLTVTVRHFSLLDSLRKGPTQTVKTNKANSLKPHIKISYFNVVTQAMMTLGNIHKTT